jgi:hypothetical protein
LLLHELFCLIMIFWHLLTLYQAIALSRTQCENAYEKGRFHVTEAAPPELGRYAYPATLWLR